MKTMVKGRKGEYIVRDLLRGFGYKAERTPLSGAIETWKGDITSPGFPFFLEVKNTKRTEFKKWYKKANDESGAKPPLIAWVDRGQVFAFVMLSDVLMLMKSGKINTIKKPVKKKVGIDYTKLKYGK